jgi:hypothetical protein
MAARRDASTLLLVMAAAAAAVATAAAHVASAADVGAATDVDCAGGVATAVTHLVRLEVIERPVSGDRMWTDVAPTCIEAVINVAAEVSVAAEPRASADERAVVEPLRPVVSVWGAGVWLGVVVAVRAIRLSDTDRNLGGCGARNAQQSGRQGKKDKQFPIAHGFLTPE